MKKGTRGKKKKGKKGKKERKERKEERKKSRKSGGQRRSQATTREKFMVGEDRRNSKRERK